MGAFLTVSRALVPVFWVFALSFALPLVTGCSTLATVSGEGYDTRVLSIQTLGLFPQRIPSTLRNNSWKGDWLFRRDRLELIDSDLRRSNPDIMIFQDLMVKKGNPFESDYRILAEGALKGYQWDLIKSNEYSDTGEIQYQAVAVGLPISRHRLPDKMVRFWPIGANGFLTLSLLKLENDPILVFNVQMPRAKGDVQPWYAFLTKKVNQALDRILSCPNRVIVAGYLPVDFSSRYYQQFLNALGLKDSAEGFCEIASDCHTATPLNDIFLAALGDRRPSRQDRILVHRGSIVISSVPAFNKSSVKKEYLDDYGLSKLWPSIRYGWKTRIRLNRCSR